MAKKFTLQQIQRNGSAIQLYERSSAPWADVVNCARYQLLAGAGFSLDQDGGVGGRNSFDLFEHRFQCRTVSNELFESAGTAVTVIRSDSVESFHENLLVSRAEVGSTL